MEGDKVVVHITVNGEIIDDGDSPSFETETLALEYIAYWLHENGNVDYDKIEIKPLPKG